MNNLIKHKDIVGLSPLARDIYSASKKPIIKSFSDMNIVVNHLHQSVSRVIADKGVRMELDEINYLKQTITKDIISDFSNLTLDDISVCFSLGVRGGLGDYYGINVATLYQWLVTYKNEIIPKANAEIIPLLPKENVVENKISPKEFDYILIDEISNLLIGNIELSNYNDFGNIHYNFLERINVLNFSTEEKVALFNRAYDLVKQKLTERNIELMATGKSAQMINLNTFFSEIETKNKSTREIVVIEAKKLAFVEHLTNVNDKENYINELKNKVNSYYENR